MAVHTRLSEAEQLERFGMSFAAAHKVRDRAKAVCAAMGEAETAKAQKAWGDLAYELRGNKGQPFQCPRHPEAVRIKLLSALADGASISDAIEAARQFAWSEAA